MTSCTSSFDPGGASSETTGVRQLAYAVDGDGMPDIDLVDLPPLGGRVVFPELSGRDLDDGVAWAEQLGWEQIQIIDLDPDEETFYSMEGRPPAIRITLKHRDRIIVEAAAG